MLEEIKKVDAYLTYCKDLAAWFIEHGEAKKKPETMHRMFVNAEQLSKNSGLGIGRHYI